VGAQLPHREWNWLFEFNDWHQLLHVVTGAILLAGGLRREWAGRAAIAFGAVYLVLTPLAVIDGDDVADVIYSDGRDNFIHGLFAVEALVLGLAAAVAGAATPRARSRAPSPPGAS
jgi:hypothetical protein